MKFYTSDWYEGTKVLSHKIKGRYIDLLCLIWNKGVIGKMIISITELANLWSIPCEYEDQNTPENWEEQTITTLNVLENSGCIEYRKMKNGTMFEIFQKRIAIDQKELIDNANRQARFKGNARGNAIGNDLGNAKVTPKKLEVRSKNIYNYIGPIPKEAPKNGANVFTKPTLEELRNYLKEKDSPVDAEAFYAFYESNGWRVGKNPMKSWRAAVTTWEKNNFAKTPKTEVYDWKNTPIPKK